MTKESTLEVSTPTVSPLSSPDIGFSVFLVAYRWPLMLLSLVLAGWCFLHQEMHFDRSIEKMFAPGDPLLAPFHQLRQEFGGEEVVVVAYHDPQLLTTGIKRLRELRAKLKAVPGIDPASILSLDMAPLKNPEPFLDFLEGLAVSSDRRTTALLCSLKPENAADATLPPRTETLSTIRKLALAHDPTAVVVGEAVMVADGFNYLEADGVLLANATTGLLMLVIILLFRSLRWTLIPLAVVFTSLWWTRGSLVLLNFQLSMVSSMLTAIITVIGIATIIHFIVRYRSGRQAGFTPERAVILAGNLLWVPIAWSCFTDAVGFGALWFSQVGPVQSFGLMMALGAVLTLLAVMGLVPGLALLGRFDQTPRRAWGEGGLDWGLSKISWHIQQRPQWVIGLSLLLTALGVAGLFRLEIETDFTKNFRSNSPIVTSYQFIEEHLGGAGAWDILIPAPERLNDDFLDRLRFLQERLRTEVLVTDANGQQRNGLTKVVSLVDALDSMEAVDPLGGTLARFSPIKLRMRLLEKTVAPFARAVYSSDPQTGELRTIRVLLRSLEQQPAAAKTQLIAQVRQIVKEEFPEAKVTGFFVLLASLIQSLLADQWLTFGLAMLGVFLMISVAFRSPALALAALFPNALPIVVVLGGMGWLGFKLNMGAVMIASVSMGLAVDSSIHYFSALKHEMLSGFSLEESLHQVHLSVGRAMVFSNLALMVGFSALCLSHFIPTIYFGVLVSLSLFGGLLGNLILLPVLLRYSARFIRW